MHCSVTLTSPVGKVMDLFILDSIAERLKQQNLTVDSEYGVKPSGR